MGLEIERKFLLKNESWRENAVGQKFCQGYAMAKNGVFRVRIAGEKAWLTIKSDNKGAVRHEFEYKIPVIDAEDLLETVCEKPYIKKIRYNVEYAGKLWEIDEFEGDNAGLVVAEIELNSEEEEFSIPSWAGEEVTSDARYYNSNLVKHPYSEWK